MTRTFSTCYWGGYVFWFSSFTTNESLFLLKKKKITPKNNNNNKITLRLTLCINYTFVLFCEYKNYCYIWLGSLKILWFYHVTSFWYQVSESHSLQYWASFALWIKKMMNQAYYNLSIGLFLITNRYFPKLL